MACIACVSVYTFLKITILYIRLSRLEKNTHIYNWFIHACYLFFLLATYIYHCADFVRAYRQSAHEGKKSLYPREGTVC